MPKYYRMENLADILTVKLLTDKKIIEGDFIKSENSKGEILFRLLEKKHSYFNPRFYTDNLHWERVDNPNDFDEVDWLELFQKIILRKDFSSKIAKNIILKTSEKGIFIDAIRKHFMLQKGSLTFSNPTKESPYWLIKIENPSLWAIVQLENDNLKIFSQTHISPLLYLENGYEIIEKDLISNKHQLNFDGANTFLLDSEGKFNAFSVNWQTYDKIIKVNVEKPLESSLLPDFKIEIEPKLVRISEKKVSSLWQINDLEKIKNILSLTLSSKISGFKAWFGKSEELFIYSENLHSDPVFKNLLNDSFKSFYKLKQYVFVPVGTTLIPPFEEEEILRLYNVPSKDYLCLIDKENDNYDSILFPGKDLKHLSRFVNYKVANLLDKLESFDSNWFFDLSSFNSQTSKIIIEKEIVREIEFKKKKTEITANSKVQENQSEVKTIIATSDEIIDINQIRKEIYEIDKNILNDFSNISLWDRRSELSKSLNNITSSIVSKVTGLIISNNIDKIFEVLEENFNSIFQSSFSGKEEEKGKILAEIRQETVAEINFLKQLLFAKKYSDSDVLSYALDSMRKGYDGYNCWFHKFEEKSFTKDDNDSDSLNLTIKSDNFDKIIKNINNFVDVLNRKNSKFNPHIFKQFKILLGSNLPELEDLIPEIPEELPENIPISLENLWQDLENYPLFFAHMLSKQKLNWLKGIEMKNLFSTPVEDFFTGESVRATFPVENPNLSTLIALRDVVKEVAKKGPLKEFLEWCQEPWYQWKETYFYTIVRNCDIYRLHIRYGKSLDKEKLFTYMIDDLLMELGFIDFRDAAEDIISCLFITGSENRSEYINKILLKTLSFLEQYQEHEDLCSDVLSLITYIEASLLLEDLPASIDEYNFNDRRKSIWMDFASELNRKENLYGGVIK